MIQVIFTRQYTHLCIDCLCFIDIYMLQNMHARARVCVLE